MFLQRTDTSVRQSDRRKTKLPSFPFINPFLIKDLGLREGLIQFASGKMWISPLVYFVSNISFYIIIDNSPLFGRMKIQLIF